MPGFYVTSVVFFGIWWLLSSRLSYWSLRQDETGAPLCTYKMRFHSGWGIVALALTLTFSAALWMKALQFQWFSAVYGVYFFSICAWVRLATVYAITALLQRQRILESVLHDNQFFYLGLLSSLSPFLRLTTNLRNILWSGMETSRKKPSGISSANAVRGGA